MKKKYNDQPIKEAMQQWLNQSDKFKKNLHRVAIRQVWEEKMGKTINDYTKDIKLIRKKLYLTIESAPLKQELSYSRDQIKEMLNKHIGEAYIDEVIIR